MSSVVAAVDSSVATRPVLATARNLGLVLGARVLAVHVGDVGETARNEADLLGVDLLALSGEPLEALSRRASDGDVVAVVVGVRNSISGPNRMGHLALGLADVSTKPVLLVPPNIEVPERIRRVVVAVKGTPAQARPLRRTLTIVERAELELVVVHVEEEDELPAFSDQPQYEYADYADEFLARHVPGAPRAAVQLRAGDPVAEILTAAREERAEILAIGWSQNGRPERGHTSRSLATASPIPVLLVPLE